MKFTETHPNFQTEIREIAESAGQTPERIYQLWQDYAKQCWAGDQSPVTGEFRQLIKETLEMVQAFNADQPLPIRGLKVDAQKIANGIYQMICERGEEALVAFGMLPKPMMDLAERSLNEKITALAKAQNIQVDPKRLKLTVDPILKEICHGIYAAASAAGKMVV